jgi:flap endonuclease-1
MGVKHLNQYLRKNCVRGIRYTTVAALRGKHVVVDAYNYMYKFKLSNTLEEQFQKFINVFLSKGVQLTFVFDGKPPQHKMVELERRRIRKKAARAALITETNQSRIEKLKRKCVCITHEDIHAVKTTLIDRAIPFITAVGESDELCARMVHDGQADACLSDDMDMLVYGCPWVLRNLNIYTEAVTSYSLDIILEFLKVSRDDFRKICVVAGTDYYKSSLPLPSIFTLYSEYQKECSSCFLKWVSDKKGLDCSKLQDTFNLFAV